MQPTPPRRSTHVTAGPANLLVYDRWGRYGRPVLLLHGLLFDRTMWWPVAAELAARCTVIAPDLPGHGQSAPRADCSPARIAEDLATLVNNLGLHRAPIVVGHATSAWLAAAFAGSYATHHLLLVDEPRPTSAAASVDELIAAAHLEQVPAQHRQFAQPARDPALLQAYACWFALPPTRRATPVPSATAGGSPGRAEAGFVPLVDPAESAATIRALR